MEKWWNIVNYSIEELLCMGVVLLIIFSIVQLHKINKMNKQIRSIIQGVEHYLSVVMEEEADAYSDEKANIIHNEDKAKEQEKEKEMEAQSSLISAVLQEIFP